MQHGGGLTMQGPSDAQPQSQRGGLEPDAAPARATLIARLAHWARVQPRKPVFTWLNDAGDVEDELTYHQLRAATASLAGSLEAAGLRGHTAALIHQGTREFIPAFLACLEAGVVPAPLAPPKRNRSNHRLVSVAAKAHVGATLTDAKSLAALAADPLWSAQLGTLPMVATDVDPPGLARLAPVAGTNGRPRHVEDVAFLQFTSGSTSTPKGVVITHDNLVSNLDMIVACVGTSPEMVAVCWMPHFHDLGLVGNLLHTLYCGGRCILLSPASIIARPIAWLRALHDHRGTYTTAPNFAYDRCVAKIPPSDSEGLDLSCVRVAINAAEPVRQKTLDAFVARFGRCGFDAHAFMPAYGMAEATVFISGAGLGHASGRLRLDRVKYASHARALDAAHEEDSLAIVGCGRPWLGSEVRIVDPSGLRALGPREIGEIWVAGRHVTPGYFDDDAANGSTFATLDGQRYLRTGDLGFVDERGELYVSGRLKDLIILNGMNIHPADVEQAVACVHPDLRPGGVAALSSTEDGIERLFIAVEVERDAVAAMRRDPARVTHLAHLIRDAVGRQLDAAVTRILFLKPGQLPKTSSGKVRRRECLAAIESGTLEGLATWPGASLAGGSTSGAGGNIATALLAINSLGPDHLLVLTHLLQVLSDELRLSLADLDLSKSIFFYGIDSIKLVDMHTELERRLGARLPTDVLFAARTLLELVDGLVSATSRRGTEVKDHSLRAEIDEWTERLAGDLDRARADGRTASERAAALLTGGTGYVGIYLLKELLEHTDWTIHCVTRAVDPAAGMQRLARNADRYTLEMPADWQRRVKVVIGDVSKERFGLRDDAYVELATRVGSVFHCAAVDNFYLPYAVLRHTNVLGAMNVASFCLEGGLKPLHYVSSCAAELVRGDDPKTEMIGLLNGYAQSKFVAEQVVLRLIERGFPAVNYRFGYLYSLEADMADEDESFETLLTAMFHMGCVPDIDAVFDLTPVEYAVRCMRRRALQAEPADGRSNYTLYNPVPLDWRHVEHALMQRRPGLRAVSLREFTERFQDYVRRSTRKSVKLLKAVVSEELAGQLNCMFRDVAIDDLGFLPDGCPPCDAEFARHYIDLVLGAAAPDEPRGFTRLVGERAP